MTSLQLMPAALSAVVLAAHFLRAGNPVLFLAALSVIVLMFVRHALAARLIRLGLFLGTIEWLRTLTVLVSVRRQSGQPFTRLALILGAVAAVTAASALVFRTRTLRQYFRLSATQDDRA